ncbi:uncharacterized protein K441DRAFT_741555 [Cenococcum geophilum 1.58]|uniref:Uncharacterized protein n=1 Tax=Cenococcum geophilum 1.58 TaxID=794803 RepID=A0ACC8EN33_9PEZI|nr:hypothetical protein K441DRAFT_741555 [Cenococcum geophilum 1.58]
MQLYREKTSSVMSRHHKGSRRTQHQPSSAPPPPTSAHPQSPACAPPSQSPRPGHSPRPRMQTVCLPFRYTSTPLSPQSREVLAPSEPSRC